MIMLVAADSIFLNVHATLPDPDGIASWDEGAVSSLLISNELLIQIKAV